MSRWTWCACWIVGMVGVAQAQLCNIKVVTDASPDYHDLPAMVHSMTNRWETPAEKCWAVFYWNHIARRQTNPMYLYGMALTDPVRQFNDYGFTMCSTISGINQSIWEQMGLKHRYWDISNHTVSEVFYDGGWHMYDNSMSAIYTLCDGKTIAGVADIGKAGACAASGGKEEPGHIARYHCLNSTSPNGFLTGADTIRSTEEEYRCFNPNGLKLRTYFYDWDNGHRYILNLRPGEVYTRYYRSLGTDADFFVPNSNGKDPEATNTRYRIRGNGEWRFDPDLTDAKELAKVVHSMEGLTIAERAGARGLVPVNPDKPGWVVFRLHTPNVMTGLEMTLDISGFAGKHVRFSVSRDNGRTWHDLRREVSPPFATKVWADAQVNGAYEVLVKAADLVGDVALHRWRFLATTMLNSKTQPKLNLGRNVVYVGAGEQTDSIVLWPELQNDKYKDLVVEEKNISSVKQHPGYMGTIHPTVAKEDAYVVYRIDAPRDLTRLIIGGRFYNRAPKSRIEMHYSLDNKTWTKAWELTDTQQPWDVIKYVPIDIPAGHRTAWVKYLMNTTEPKVSGCSIYAVRIEANHKAIEEKTPVDVTFTWKERRNGQLVERSHWALVDKLPATYVINVGGDDHPIMESLAVNLQGAQPARYGYSDGTDLGGERFVGTWETAGRNLAVGKKYTLSHPSTNNWGSGDPDGTKLTDGIVGPPYAGGTSYKSGVAWNSKTDPAITLDLGASVSCASFGLNIHGYPFHDALKGQVKDRVEVQVSDDGKEFRSIGVLPTELKWKDLPANHMWPDEEAISGHTYRLVPEKPVSTRYVRFQIQSQRILCATEIEVLDSIRREPFDLRIALPADAPK